MKNKEKIEMEYYWDNCTEEHTGFLGLIPDYPFEELYNFDLKCWKTFKELSPQNQYDIQRRWIKLQKGKRWDYFTIYERMYELRKIRDYIGGGWELKEIGIYKDRICERCITKEFKYYSSRVQIFLAMWLPDKPKGRTVKQKNIDIQQATLF